MLRYRNTDYASGIRVVLPLLAVALLLLLPVSAVSSSWWDKSKEVFMGGMKTKPLTESVLSENDIIAGLKEALQVSSERVVSQLGATDGFMADPEIHIPLPGYLENVRTGLNAIGQSALMDDLELKLNRAAEQATPQARELFLTSIKEMSFDEARNIYEGPDDAATQYFKGKMSDPLKEAMSPIVSQSMSDVGAVQAYDAAIGQYKQLPFVPDVQGDLTQHVVGKGLDGIFYYLAREEAAIRKDPVKRTTEILQQVFGP